MSTGIFGVVYYVDAIGKKIEEYIQNQLTEDLEYDKILLSEYFATFISEPVIKGK